MVRKNKFNPIKEETGDQASQRVIWTTEIIYTAREALEKGKRLKANPFHDGNEVKLLKPNLVYERTDEEIAEWKKCAADELYFANTYAQLMTPQGIQHVTLRDYQEEYLDICNNHRLTILLSCRQAGKTITSAIDLLHFICFNFDKTGAVLGNKRKTAVEILSKAKDIFKELPYWMKPGVVKWNESDIVLDNGCRIKAEATTKTPNLGDTIHWCLWDEAAHVAPNIIESFYNNLFPTITASRAIFRITSTQNGYNLFSELYMAAVARDSEYFPYKVDWFQVPEWDPDKKEWVKRDEKWKKKQIANLGGEEAFNKQFGTEFIITSNTLLSRKFISKHEKIVEQFENKDIPGVYISDSWWWKPDFDPMNLKNEFVIFTNDLAEGLGQDDNIFSCWRLIDDGKLEKIGFFKDNKHSREEVALSFVQLVSMHCNPTRYLISVEWNTYGELFVKDTISLENDYPAFARDNFIKYYTGESNVGKYRLGIKLTPGNKTPHCQLFKEDLESGKIVDTCHITHQQLKNFGDLSGPSSPQKRYGALYGHDDLVMSAVQLEFVKETLQYTLFLEDYRAHVDVEDEQLYNPYEMPDMIPMKYNEPYSIWTQNENNLSRIK